MSSRAVGINDRGLRVGQDHHNAKLTDAEVDMLLELREQGWSYNQLVEKFEISKSQVARICTGKHRSQTTVGFRTVSFPS